ncbi:hypothetical protein L195_g030582 [Trifolium pratense]|uniref:Uncharacterized protein n=1 Tax=Trifolium pratense TaxID=57577 RepID=A0A2K3L7Z4_TRIPR|nr:hypothetical protein L195_g030582 [Trifolium pratense]
MGFLGGFMFKLENRAPASGKLGERALQRGMLVVCSPVAMKPLTSFCWMVADSCSEE